MTFQLSKEQIKNIGELFGVGTNTSKIVKDIEGRCKSYLSEKKLFKNQPNQGVFNRKMWQLQESVKALSSNLDDPLTQMAMHEYCGSDPDCFSNPSITDIKRDLNQFTQILAGVKKPGKGRPQGGGAKTAESSLLNSLYDICIKAGKKPTIINNDTYCGLLHEIINVLGQSPEFSNLGSLGGKANGVIKWRTEIEKREGSPIDLGKAPQQTERS
jgi:hypothetical protein